MSVFSDLATDARSLRERVNSDEAAKRERLSGVTRLADDIAQISAIAGAILAAAVVELAEAGLLLKVEELWGDHQRPKAAGYQITCEAGEGWPSSCLARSPRVVLAMKAGVITLTAKPITPLDAIGDAIDCEPGDEVAAGVRFAVTEFLTRAGAGPVMQGFELRTSQAG